MSNQGNEPDHRVQLDFSPEAFEKLGEIRKLAGVEKNADAVRNALRFYEWFLLKRADGYQLFIGKDEEEDVTQVELRF